MSKIPYWKHGYGTLICSECGYVISEEDDMKRYLDYRKNRKICPACKVDMREPLKRCYYKGNFPDKNGVTRYVTEVSVHNAAFTGEKREQGQEQAAPQNAPQTSAQPQNQPPHGSTYSAEDFADTQNGDDYPF